MRAILCTLLVALAGCPSDDPPQPRVELYGITKPPPASTGTIETDYFEDIHQIELSQGVALAARCWESCDTVYGACAAPKFSVADATLLDVRPVYHLNGGDGEVVLVAKRAGTTTVNVASTCGVQTYVVRVLPRGP